jgi:uncharacterized damage-inducible protein DinB
MNEPSIALAVLLADNELSAQKWQTWFASTPAALDLPCDIYNSGSVRALLRHIFAVELRHSQRLLGKDVTAYEAISTDSLASLFAVHAQAVDHLRTFLANASESSLQETLAISTLSAGTLHATRRKLVVHILLHSIRHWAQLATLLRAHGYSTDWAKDFLMSDAME